MSLAGIAIRAAKFARTASAVTTAAATVDPEPVSKGGGYVTAGLCLVGSICLEVVIRNLAQDAYDQAKQRLRSN